MLSLNRLQSSFPAAVLVGAAICVAAGLASELAYRAGFAEAPGSVRRFFGTPSPNSNAPGTGIEGPANDRLETLRVRAYWSKPELLPRFENFARDGAAFHALLSEHLGNGVTPKRVKARTTVRNLLDERDAYLHDMQKMDRGVTVSQRDPATDAALLSADEREVLEGVRTIAATVVALDESRSGDQHLADKLREAQSRFGERRDIFINPAISTAVLRRAAEEGLMVPAESDAELFRHALLDIAKETSADEIEKIRKNRIDALLLRGKCVTSLNYNCPRDLSLKDMGLSAVPNVNDGNDFLSKSYRGQGSDESRTLIGNAYLNPLIPTDMLNTAARWFATRRQIKLGSGK